MNAKELHGKPVRGMVSADGSQRFSPGMVFHYEYHGEYDDAWVLVIEGGREVERHNVRHLQSIFWVEEPSQ